MKRQSSTRATPRRVDGQQPSLKSYFKPKQASSPKSVVQQKSDAPVTPVKIIDSSSDDDLPSADTLIQTRSSARKVSGTGTNTPRTRDRVQLSPSPPRVALASGAFSLEALLADRTQRIEQKATIERLETIKQNTTTTEQQFDGLSKANAAHLSDRVQQLLATDKQEEEVYWCFVSQNSTSTSVARPRCTAEMRASLPDVTFKTDMEELAGAELCHWFSLSGQPLSDSWMDFFSTMVRASEDVTEIHEITQLLLRQADFNINQCFTLAQQIVGVDSDTTKEHCSKGRAPPVNVLTLARLQAAISLLLSKVLAFDAQEQVSDFPWADLIRFTTSLQLDDTYGHLLVTQLRKLQHAVLDIVSQDPDGKLYMVLTDMTKNIYFQIRIVENMPVHDTTSIARMQAMASLFLLNLDAASYHSIEQDWRRLDLLTRFLQTSVPFHPLTEETSYQDIKQKINLLSLATSHIDGSGAENMRRLIESLQALHGRIQDGKAAFISRSEAKAAIQRLSDRLKYTLAAQSRKHSVFEHFS